MDPTRRKTIHDALVRLADGDRSAFPLLLENLWPVLLSFTERGVAQREDAEDLAQNVFVRICSRISEFDRERDGVSWAFGIASYEILTHRRRLQRRRETFDEAALQVSPDPAESPEDSLIRHELAAALACAVGELSAEDRSTLGLGKGPAPSELKGATLRKRRQRALDRLRAAWRRLYGGH